MTQSFTTNEVSALAIIRTIGKKRNTYYISLAMIGKSDGWDVNVSRRQDDDIHHERSECYVNNNNCYFLKIGNGRIKEMGKKNGKRNEGKIFEDCIANSCPRYVLVKKLADNASGWNGGKKTSYATSNECDFIMHDEESGIFYGLECKSTKGPSMTFWRKDFQERSKGTHFVIGKKQILGLEKWDNAHKGVFGFLLNFRNKDNATYFVSIGEFLNYTQGLTKHCINISDIKAMNGIKIDNKKLKTNYRYDMGVFFKTMQAQYETE